MNKVNGDSRTLETRKTRHGERYLVSVGNMESRWVSVPEREDTCEECGTELEYDGPGERCPWCDRR